MPAGRDRQSSFAGGEYAPGMYGRTDFAGYSSGCRTVFNFFVTPWGTLANRPGTRRLIGLRSVTGELRMETFWFGDHFVILVCKEKLFEIYKFANDVLTEVWSGYATYSETEAKRLRFGQVGDTITMTDTAGQLLAQVLRRLDANSTSWEIDPLDTGVPDYPFWLGEPCLDINYFAGNESFPAHPWQWAVTRLMEDSDGRVYETGAHIVDRVRRIRAHEWSANNDYPFREPHVASSLIYLELFNVWVDPYDGYLYSCEGKLPSGDGLSTGDVGAYGPQRPSGGATTDFWAPITYTPDALQTYHTIPIEVAVYAEYPAYIDWHLPEITYANPPDVDTPVGVRVYRGREGRYGYVGQVMGGFHDGTRFKDEGATPDWSRVPPSGENPFASATQYPKLVSMYEGRRILAGTIDEPTTIWASATEQYDNFDIHTPALDSDALKFELASIGYEKIRGIIPRQKLIVFTDDNEWLVGGSGQDEVITPNSIARRPLSAFGCSELQPLEVDDQILFLQRIGNLPRSMMINANGIFQTIDISKLSRHLFMGKTIVSWAYAENPWSLVWAVLSDGTLLSCTLILEEGMVAWARHEIPGALVKSVLAVQHGNENTIILQLTRDGIVTLELLTTRLVTDEREGVFLDSSVTIDGRNTDTTLTATITAADSASRGRYYEVQVDIIEGFKYTGKLLRVNGDGGDTVLVRIHTRNGADDYTGELLEDLPDDMDGQTYTDWSLCVRTVDGLGHLNGSEVYALLDGHVAGPFTVEGGMVNVVPTDEDAAAIAHVGLRYNCDFESLNMAHEKGRPKIVKEAFVELEGSRGGWVGQTLDDLQEIRTRQVGHDYDPGPLVTGEYPVPVKSGWDEHGRLAIRQTQPLPMTLLGFTRKVEFGE